MAWIESHDELPTHPKTRKAARKLKVCVPQVIGHLHVLWYWCITHRPDGRLDGMDVDDIADAAGWDDDPETFTTAMLAAGWLDEDDGTLVVHDWWEHAGQTIARRDKATAEQRESGRLGAHNRWCVREGRPIPNCKHCGGGVDPTKGTDGTHDAPPNGDPIGSDGYRDRDRDRDKNPTPSSTDVDQPTDDGFDHFWQVWPKRNGKKLAKDKAHRAWSRLTLPERREAFRGAKNYADASNAGLAGAKDAFRWLQGREWPDWQEPAKPDPKQAAPKQDPIAAQRGAGWR